MNFKVSSLMTNSRRVCAVLFESTDVRLLCICVYIMPYKSDASSIAEFEFQLSIIDTLLEQHSDCHVLVGGDFNVDFSRNWANSWVLDEYCTNTHLFPVIRNKCSTVDYTYHLCMKRFATIDHFLAVIEQFVMHDVDNTSDHESCA